MKNKMLKISVLVIMLVVTIFALSACTETNNTENNVSTTNVEVTECEHDWVVTSKYSFFTDSYKTVSKCSKCGKVVE